MVEEPPCRYDYGILLDYDPFGTISRNLLEYFRTYCCCPIELLRIREPSFQNLVDDTVYNSLLVVLALL